MLTTRRSFIRGALAATLAAPIARAAEPASPIRIIDTHQHLWDLGGIKPPWLAKAGPRLNRNYTPDDYARAIEGTNIVKSIYVEIATAPEDQQAEADYVIQLCAAGKTPLAGAVIAGDPAAAQFRKYITQFKGNAAVKGLRHQYAKGDCEDKDFLGGIRLLGELGLTFDLQGSNVHLAEMARLVQACPDTRFVLDHCGSANVRHLTPAPQVDPLVKEARRNWEEGIARLAELKNVVCKISGVVETADPQNLTPEALGPAVNHCIDRFGDERIMFSGNWPVCLRGAPLARWVELLKQVIAPLGAAFAGKLFYGNAARFYGLEK